MMANFTLVCKCFKLFHCSEALTLSAHTIHHPQPRIYRAERHDFKSNSFPIFSSLLKKREKKKRRINSKNRDSKPISYIYFLTKYYDISKVKIVLLKCKINTEG